MATSILQSVIGLTFNGLLDSGVTAAINQSKLVSSGLNSATGINLDPSFSFTNGTGAGQANKWFLSYRTLAATTADDMDLSGTAIQDPFGNNLAFTKIKSIVIVIDYALVAYDGTKTLEVGPGGVSAPFLGPFGDATDKLTIDKWFALGVGSAAGWGVTATTADIFRIKNPGASPLNYLVWLQGI